jgi:uncharacterized protein
MPFAWDPEKAAENVGKHGVAFEEALTVFADPLSKTLLDPEHSEGEERYLEVGYSSQGRLLIVSYTERQEQIRIISVRLATRKERQHYEEN